MKDLLLALSTYPDVTPASAIDSAVSFTTLINGRLSSAMFEITAPPAARFYAEAILHVPEAITAAQEKSSANLRELRAEFDRRAGRVIGDVLVQQCAAADVPDRLTELARVRDLTIIPVRESNGVERWYAEAVIFGSGRPALILPDAQCGNLASISRIVVGWDSSRTAARALGDAMPLLQKAQAVHVVTVRGEKEVASPLCLVSHLRLHGINAVLEELDGGGQATSSTLIGYLHSRGADILVMGAYGHSRMRDFILGGVTKTLLAHPPVPIFLSH
jgi:nucleotide-binding universal stress UspA family protein